MKTKPRLEAVLWVMLLVIPLVIGLAWGTMFDDGAYVTFRCARNLATGRGLTHDLEMRSASGAPLYILALALSARLGVPLLQAGLVLSALGWGAAAIAVYCTGRAMHRPVAAVMSAALVPFCPAVVSTLGTEASWAVALAWAAVAASLKKRWNAQAGLLALMLCVHFGLSTAALAALLLLAQWIERRRFPLWPALILTIVVLGWVWVAAVTHVPIIPPHHLTLDVGRWSAAARQLVGESEFYWLFLPLFLCGGIGVFTTARRAWWGGVLWGAASVLGGGPVAGAALVTLGLFLAGLGVGWMIAWVEGRGLVRLNRFALTVSLALVAGSPLGIAQVSSLYQRYQLRPIIRQAVEQQVGDWLRAHGEPAATVFGSERVGYLADRPTLPWDGSDSDQAALAALLKTLNEAPPEYCVSVRSIGWDHLMRTGWFRANYAPLRTFRSPYAAASPFTVWRYRFGGFDLGERQPLNVHLPGEVDLVGYRYGPDRIQPGSAVYATLFLRGTRPITDPFRIVIWVISPQDGVSWAQRDAIISHESGLVGWWQTGEAISERFVLTTTADIPVGAYHLKMSVAAPYSVDVLPIYRDDDASPLDQIILGDVVVPWRGELDVEKPLGANFGDQISLLGFDVADSLSPGAEFDVTLYWEALRPPDDDYVVFIHLLDIEGQVVASHDGPPMDGRYATGTWLPGEVVPDVHRLTLDPNAPAGLYRLRVGVYQWPSLERLPAWDGQGVEQAERVILLQSVVVEE